MLPQKRQGSKEVRKREGKTKTRFKPHKGDEMQLIAPIKVSQSLQLLIPSMWASVQMETRSPKIWAV
jgi:hypothetical protein